MAAAPRFHVIPGTAVERVIHGSRDAVFQAVEAAYRLHAAGETVNPDSYFLRFPDKPNARIIALPAHVGGAVQKSGIKWISSFPDNRAHNLARASAVLILNDAATGYPVACIESALISATRTAASAALAAEHMSPKPFEGALSIVGTGIIARTTVEWLLFRKWRFNSVNLYDLDRKEAERFAGWLRERHDLNVKIREHLEDAFGDSSLVLFTTTTGEPYLGDEKLLRHCPTVLHLSLRDLCINVIMGAQNIVDDVDHCLKANTSLHLAEKATGNRAFVAGTLVSVLDGKVKPDPERPRIFSPFGLGVLDLAVGNLVLEKAAASGDTIAVPDFFSTAARW
jgi:ornithine cyclodeaminase